ncbi:MAG: S41 family peptidase [Myxococcota bacterium]|nr:S41 family peptidase [Myxococcota bacterium]
MQKNILSLLSFSLSLPFLMGFDSTQLDCAVLPHVLTIMEDGHYAQDVVTPSLKERSVKTYIERMDPTKTLFLQDEIQDLQNELVANFTRLQRGDCSDLEKVARLSVERIEENERIVRERLGNEFVLDKQLKLQTDPSKRNYPASEKERTVLIESLLHFQVANQRVLETDLEKISKRLVHRYELASKRARERREKRDVPELFAAAYAAAMDPHSDYYSADQLADFQIQMGLSLEGIGAVLRSEDGYTKIVSIVTGGPADKEGSLMPNDSIVAVKNEGKEPVSTIDMALQDVVKMIRGKKGTRVTLTIFREGASVKTFQVTIQRDKIDVKEQAAKISLQSRKQAGKTYKLATISLPSFYKEKGGGGRDSLNDMKNLIREAKREGVDGILVDLSENGGGLLDHAVSISGLFVKEGAIVGTNEKQQNGRDQFQVLNDRDSSIEYSGPLVVLVSQASASASEILAGALQDYSRAVIVGSKNTFGKGTVQHFFPLMEMGAIKQTKGMFFRPSGSSTQHVGVSSDIFIPSLYDGYELGEANLDYSLPPQSMPSFLSDRVNSRVRSRWTPVTEAQKKVLSQRSADRIASNSDFAELEKQVAEIQNDDGVVTIASLLQDSEEKEENESGAEDSNDIFELQKEEAINILTDLIELQQK